MADAACCCVGCVVVVVDAFVGAGIMGGLEVDVVVGCCDALGGGILLLLLEDDGGGIVEPACSVCRLASTS